MTYRMLASGPRILLPSVSRQKVACHVPSDLMVRYTLLERFTLLKNNNFLFV